MATMKITVDAELCSGQGRCYVVAPDLFSPDDEGFCAQRDGNPPCVVTPIDFEECQS